MPSLRRDLLVWMDLEMSGLEVDTDKILELAVVITDNDLNIIGELPPLVIHQSNQLLDKMDEWNQKTHQKSGLIEKVKASSISEAEAEEEIVNFLKKYLLEKSSPLCGNSIYNDRKFISKYMKSLDNFLHYRLIDVSTIKELALRSGIKKFEKAETHTALKDIHESIAELKYYKQTFFKTHSSKNL